MIGTVNVLEAARAVGARVLFGSTGGVMYGRDAPIPSLEDVLPLPESPYGVAKHCAEQYVGSTTGCTGRATPSCGSRTSTGRGRIRPGEAGVVAIFCAQALAGERPDSSTATVSQTRDYVYVGDAVAAFLAAADSGRPGTWNIGTGVEVSVLELTQVISEVTGQARSTRSSPRPRPGELLRSALAVASGPRPISAGAATTPAGRRHRRGCTGGSRQARRSGRAGSTRLAGHVTTRRPTARSAPRSQDHQGLAGPRRRIGARSSSARPGCCARRACRRNCRAGGGAADRAG